MSSLIKIINNEYRKLLPKALVLIYHRVGDLENDPQNLSISAEKFEAQMKYLKENYKVISLKELTKDLKKKKIKHNSVVITFDDGYADNLYNAKPILEKYNIPATVFITGEMINSNKEYWWDELEKIFVSDKTSIFKPLSVEINNKIYHWNINNKLDAISVYNQLHPLIKYTSNEERKNILNFLLNWADTQIEGRASHRAMTDNEIIDLSLGGLIEIGAHTVSHCVLTQETEERQLFEIIESKKILEKILNKNIESFSYPFGTSEDANDKTANLVKNCGFENGIANEQDFVTNIDNPYLIPRRLIRNWDLNEFKTNLDKYFLKDRLNIIENYVISPILGSYINHKLNKKINKKYKINKQIKELNSVLQINTQDCRGGAAKVAFDIHNKLNNTGINSCMLVDKKESKCENIDLINRNNSYLQLLLNQHQNYSSKLDSLHLSTFEIMKHDYFKKADIIHLHNLHGNYFNLAALPEISAQKHTIWTLHDMQAITGHCAHSFECDKWSIECKGCIKLNIYPAIKKDQTKYLWNKKKRIYQNLDNITIVCPSNWLKNKVEKSILKNSDIRLIYNGIDENLFFNYPKKEAREKLNLPLNKKILLFSADYGLINPWKGGKYIYKAYNQLKEDPNILFINIGSSATLQVNENWINVPYIDNQKELALYYSAADLLLYPTLADNCPLTVLESLSCGTPVVSFKTGGVPELIEHFKNGYICKYKDNNDFIKAIKTLIYDDNLLHQLSINARKTVIDKFTLDEMINNYKNLYNEVIIANQ
ncbi:MAG: glycosyltransferase [bacterium]